MRDATLVLLVRGIPAREILLGMKKAGFATGKYNGFGGKIEEGESIEQAALRELFEESGVSVSPADLKRAAHLTFVFPFKPEWDQVVHVFTATRWQGEPVETKEMRPAWFTVDAVPLSQMWADDAHWLPYILRGEFVTGRFIYGADNESITEFELK